MKLNVFIMVCAVTCNQPVYDLIYKTILVDAMHKGLTKKEFDDRNNQIEWLRKLCNGQKSSYEFHE
jgi:hypothetical protein